MTTLNQRIIEILKSYGDEFCNSDFKPEDIVNQILKEIKENPTIKKGLELLKEKRLDDKWRRNVKNR